MHHCGLCLIPCSSGWKSSSIACRKNVQFWPLFVPVIGQEYSVWPIEHSCLRNNAPEFRFDPIPVFIVRRSTEFCVIFQFWLSPRCSQGDDNSILQPECDHMTGFRDWHCGFHIRLCVVITCSQSALKFKE